MTELRLALLGPPVVLRDGLPVTFDTRKAVALLALLAVTGREHSREQLADLLWPEADTTKGRPRCGAPCRSPRPPWARA